MLQPGCIHIPKRSDPLQNSDHFIRLKDSPYRIKLMKTKLTLLLILLCATLMTSPAIAIRLELPADSPSLLQMAASLLLYAHIGGGGVGIVAGTVAALTSKGSQLHRLAGKSFFVAMLVCYIIGALVAPFLDPQQSTNFVAAVLALYLLLSGVSAASRRTFIAGPLERAGVIVVASITLLGIVFMLLSATSSTGSFDGSPPQAYLLFIVAGSFALVGECKVVYQQTLSQAARIYRHLWRICMSFFIAAGSAFFGQGVFSPDWFTALYLPLLFGFFPLLVIGIYTVKYLTRLLKQRRSMMGGQVTSKSV